MVSGGRTLPKLERPKHSSSLSGIAFTINIVHHALLQHMATACKLSLYKTTPTVRMVSACCSKQGVIGCAAQGHIKAQSKQAVVNGTPER